MCYVLKCSVNCEESLYVCGLCPGDIFVSEDISDALVFVKSDAYAFAGFLEGLVFNLELDIEVVSVSVDEMDLIDDQKWFDVGFQIL